MKSQKYKNNNSRRLLVFFYLVSILLNGSYGTAKDMSFAGSNHVAHIIAQMSERTIDSSAQPNSEDKEGSISPDSPDSQDPIKPKKPETQISGS